MKTNTVVIISVVAVAGIAFYVASRPPATSTRTIIKEKKPTGLAGLVQGVQDAYSAGKELVT
tara:strand:- start:4642 stop:4827 length:186 start_codon:yes stop_codon:yes gene_type:complete